MTETKLTKKENSFVNRIKISDTSTITRLIVGVFVVLILGTSNLFAQQTANTADKTLKGSGRVNPSTLAMEFDLPMGNYPGRGINFPISINYSSKVWRIATEEQVSFSLGGAQCSTLSFPLYAEDSASGWTTSVAVPVVEYTGWHERFTSSGFPVIDRFCENSPPPPLSSPIRRITVKMPSGESHVLVAKTGEGAGKNTYFYSQNGSNIIYYENSTTNTYKLMLPDGSHYEFDNFSQNSNQHASRKAVKYTDRNGNYTSYDATTAKWTDTLGRKFESPLKDSSSVGIKTYQLPGMTGNYKFHWKKLEDGLTNSSDQIKYAGDWYYQGNSMAQRSSSEVLFHSVYLGRLLNSTQLFNPIVLTKIELPTGQAYEFSYDIFGQITKIKYPTGGEETFVYDEIKPLTPVVQTWSDVSSQSNLGVVNRKLYETSGSNSFYEWSYSTTYVNPKGYKISIESPEGILTERFLHRGEDCNGCSTGSYGYGDILVGRAYETRVFDKLGTDGVRNLVSKNLTHWTKESSPFGSGTRDWNPRATHTESYIYDPSGNGDHVRATTKFEYEDVSTIDKPVLRKKTFQYEYEGESGSSLVNPIPPPGEDPDPNPVPMPTPTPPNLIRTSETKHLIYDSSIAQTTRTLYRNKNMVGLVTSSEIKDSANATVTRSETKYDEGVYSPAIGRGNPTTSRVWDSTKGAVTNATAYIETHAKFDGYGNLTEATDAQGRITTTEYDSSDHAFPIKVTTPIPDSSGSNGSDSAFVTQTTYDFNSSTNVGTGLPLTTTDANGQVTTIEYDSVSLRPTKVIPPAGGSIVETIYDDVNKKVTNKAQIDANNWTENITYYDGLGRTYKSEQLHSDGNIFVEKEFYSDGKVKRVSNPYRTGETKLWTKNIYDDAGRVIEVILPDGAKVNTDYAVSATGIIGTSKQITDQAGKKRKGINDVLGRMIRVIEDPSGQALETDYEFDTVGNLRKTTQGVQNRYFMHDSLGRLSYSKQPEEEANPNFVATDSITGNTAWSNKYLYDDGSNITSTTNARGVTVTATYDNFDRIVLRDYSDSTPDVNFYYDGRGLGAVPAYSKGKATKVASSISETRYTQFDNLGRLLTHQQITHGNTYQTEYTYNLSGAMMTEKYPSGRVMNYEYRADGELDKLTGTRSGNTAIKTYLSDISYNTLGNIEKMKLGNGSWESAQYNNRQQISQIALGSFEDDDSLLKIDYEYGTTNQNNGSLRKQTINYNGLTHGIVQDYSYDDLNRLKSATETSNNSQTWKQTFNYDRYGNREFDSSNTTTLAQGVATKIANPDIEASNNRLKKDQDGDSVDDYGYDKSGNLKLDAENQRFIYDAENRIKEFFKGTNSTQTADATYEYDGDGKRVRKISGTKETIFVYNASGQLVAEYSDELPPNPKVSYLTADHLGSPRIIMDDDRDVVSRHDYLAFGDGVTETVGNVAGRTTTQGYGQDDDIRKQYTGYERDKESGLDFAQARYYNSQHGRFTSVDPLLASGKSTDPQTFNRYVYVNNSPLKYTDPTGMIRKPDIIIIENGPTSGSDSKDSKAGNPIGHTAIVITGKGVFSAGNGENEPETDDKNNILGGSVKGYLEREISRRDTKITIIKTTPEQDEAAAAKFRELAKSNGKITRDAILSDNCSTRANASLDAAGLGGGDDTVTIPNPVIASNPEAPPAKLPARVIPGSAGNRAKAFGSNPVTYEIKKNSEISKEVLDAIKPFEPIKSD